MATAPGIQPLRLASVESLRAGWYLTWRVLLHVSAIVIGALGLGIFIAQAGYLRFGAIIVASGIITAVGAFITKAGKVSSRWAESRWGHTLPEEGTVWWPVLWRSGAVMMAAGAVMAPVTAMASTNVPLLLVLGAVQTVIAIVGAGWAMSKVVAEQLDGLEPVLEVEATAGRPDGAAAATPATMTTSAPAPARPAPLREPRTPAAPRPVRGQTPSTPPRPAAPSRPATPAAARDGKRQCPKCKLYETERGAVIGWHCTVCGWRESRG